MTSETIEMDQELAKRLLIEGGTLIILDVPIGTDIGIDIKSWNTGENFKGIKMIPPGIHFIHYSATDEFGETAPRVGFFHNFKKSEFVVKRWDSQVENISPESVPKETVHILKGNIQELDRYLGAYPYDIYKNWQDLTNKITDDLLERCTPQCGFIRSALELINTDDASRPRGNEINRKRKRGAGLSIEEKEKELLPDLKPKPGTEIRFTELPQKFYPDGATAAEVTRHSLDTSYTLDILFGKLKDSVEIIGELQLSFICFLAGQSLDAFEHWKSLVSLICKADTLISAQRTVYAEFLKVLEIQIGFVPEDVLCDIVASNNFVYHNLRKLFANIESNTNVDDRLKALATRMRERLTKKFFWDFNNLLEDEGDEAPVVVELNE